MSVSGPANQKDSSEAAVAGLEAAGFILKGKQIAWMLRTKLPGLVC